MTTDLQNARGEIQRLEHRIRTLERRDASPARAPERIGEATLLEDRALNRVQIKFDGIPPKEARNILRGAGFVWAPSNEAWQRKLNEGAHWKALQVLHRIYPQRPLAMTTAAPSELSKPSQAAATAEDAPAPRARETASAPPEHEVVEPDDCDGEASLAKSNCHCVKSGLVAGAMVYAVSKLKTRDGHEVDAGHEGVLVEVSCADQGPSLFLVRWGKQSPSWHDATEITTDPSVPF